VTKDTTMPEMQVIARHTMKPGTEDQVLPLVAALVTAARAEPGNLAFDVFRSPDEPRSYVLLERYADADAVAAHRDSAHFKDIVLERLVPLLEARSVETFAADPTA
jgi:quinol monooxygenase YgiN